MAKRGLGFFGGLVDGVRIADEMETSKQQRELRDLEGQKVRGELADAQKVRSEKAARESAVTDATNTNASGMAIVRNDDDGNAMPAVPGERAPRPFEVYDRAAQSRLKAGDMQGFEELNTKSASLKTMHYTTALQNAYRSGDKNAALDLMNEFPDGRKYELRQDEAGKTIGVALGQDGKVLGQMPFESDDTFWSFVSGKVNPGDIYARIRQSGLDAAALRKSNAEAGKDEAQAGVLGEQARGLKLTNAEAEKLQAIKAKDPKYYESLVNLPLQEMRAKINQANASAAASSASADLSKAQVPTAGMTEGSKNLRILTAPATGGGFGMALPEATKLAFPRSTEGTVTDPTVLAGQKALVEAYTDPVKRGQLTPEQVTLAEQILASAAGTARIPKAAPSATPGRGMGAPVPSAPDALQQARDAIARGASRDKVIERLRKSGIDPKGL